MNTDEQLKQALAKMLPTVVREHHPAHGGFKLYHMDSYGLTGAAVLDTELLHLCWLVEETFKDNQVLKENYQTALWKQDKNYPFGTNLWNQNELSRVIWNCLTFATWQQRVTALAKVKGIEVV